MRRIYTLILLAIFSWSAQAEAPASARWISINTSTHTLEVIEKGEIKQRFRNIAIGRNGFSQQHKQGDGTTPLGTFHVAWVNPDSQYNIFVGLDYPNQQLAEAAWRSDDIDFDTYYAIRRALAKGRIPPQNTVLGGYIGIHGTGHISERFHRVVNWTQGCVALTNQQIEHLVRWVKVGMKVVISNGEPASNTAVAATVPVN